MAGIRERLRRRLGLPPTPNFDSETFTKFVEILFAIVIGQSFFLLSAPQRFPTWIRAWTDNVVPLLNTILAYTVVVTSWLGYHESVKKQPLSTSLDSPSTSGCSSCITLHLFMLTLRCRSC